MTAAPLARTPQPQSAADQGVGKATPAVSVIIATYNSGSLLTCALDALEAQTLPGHLIEVLVVDDGSTDDTWRYLSELEAGAAISRSSGSPTPEGLVPDATVPSPRPPANTSSSMMLTTISALMRYAGLSESLSSRTRTS